ncbi:CC-NBS-LRR resistance protein [Trifolium pratense]|uniref:CC-NBS-LRR resistance protein n=1 Tax=Trifolium pratense TaxID=57577 RepID=A0A2K3MSZ9_TRIPR|nr:CC-NBS-LRR resistance protein [Trifolium pratense]
MAEQIPYGVATTLINRLGSAALREYGRINGVMDELERLKNTVESIRAVLLDADDKQDQSHAVQNWVRRLKDVLIPADDLLDEFFIQDMIHKRDEPHQNKVTKLNPNVVMVGENNIEWRETGSYVSESDIIGREDDKRKIISLLRQPHEIQNVSLVAIVGIGGLGKTALAQLIYNDGEIKKCFEKSMWVCVSDNFDVKTIVKNMLESLSKNKIDDTLKLDTLQNILRHTLTGKRYLLVLDDVWNESFEKWDKLRTYLMCGAPGSKVVVTTRSTIVSQTMGVSIPYVLSSLTPKESWHLLKNIITYGDESKRVNQTIESIGKKIAEKCIGVPLAIRTLGGILQGKSEEREWIDVLQGDFWKLCEDEDSIMPVLKLSYQNLSPQLRQCFAYCSLYPKDWVINKDDLIQMWIAQSYLECSTVGNQFVNILFMKSFFQDATYDDIDGRIHSFKMHDLIHDIAMQVAGNDCCYFDSGTKRLVGSPMHVMLESDAIGFLESVDASKLRTLILLSNNSERLGSKSISNLVCLQTLILARRHDLEISTKHVSMLINLKYFHISRKDVFEEKKTASGFRKLCMGDPYKGVRYLPPMERLPFLNSIRMTYLDELEYIYYEEPLSSETFFPALEILFFGKCEKLRGWWRINDDVNDDDDNSSQSHKLLFPSFPPHLKTLPGWILNLSSLQHITIEDCKNIASLPKGMSRLARCTDAIVEGKGGLRLGLLLL